jgi:hypothetical protein
MKKLFDRRMTGFTMGLCAITAMVMVAKDGPTLMALAPIAIGAIVTMFGILVTGNVAESVKTKGVSDAGKPEGQ